MAERTYVVGHVNPDTDSIASAMGYAWLLSERDGIEAVASRAGATNPQTTWILKKLGLDAPYLLTDASPRFEAVTRRLDTTTPDSPLRDAWAIAFGLNARGATGIILAGVGLAAGVIDDRIFVAIVFMALVTSILAGPMMNWLLSNRIAEARGR